MGVGSFRTRFDDVSARLQIWSLLGPPAQRQYLLPVVGRLDPRTLSGHALPLPSWATQAVPPLYFILPERLDDLFQI
jgi:hypothetical protein